jgi:acyl CoA:acetate/3-ketoacid CoA transferase alpha subunit/acyl CoA:acetate/3-ketoacid CoA transferase beta subunit
VKLEWVERFDTACRGADVVVPLEEAVAEAVRPGMTLHFAFTHNRPAAALLELLRQFRGGAPGFTVAHMFSAGPLIPLLSEGLVEKLITTLVCEPYPAPGPSRPVQRAVKAGRLELEQWSVLSYVARLRAAALGLPFLPIRGLVGSTMAEENGHALHDMPGGPLLVKPLVPDLSFVHAPCGDREGNVLLTPPYGEGAWGALAAREGVVVTVERLVSSEELRRHSHLLGIPATHVRSVSVVPFGAHPAGLSNACLPGIEPYGDDDVFYREAREASREEATWQRWIEEWAMSPGGRDGYLARLGAERQLKLKGKARADSWRAELVAALADLPLEAPPTRTEAMIVTSSRLLTRKVSEGGARAILSGMGAANLAAWLAHAALAEAGASLALVAELGMAGYTPRPCDPFLFNYRTLATCGLRTDSETALGVLVGGARARCLGALGAGQVDGAGRFNSTRLADGTPLVGSGGANDVASAADEVVITLRCGRSRLVAELPYVTGPGERVTALVTDLGVFEKERGAHRFRLTRLVGRLVGGDTESHLREIKQRVGFEFDLCSQLEVEPEPDQGTLERLRLLDPGRAFLEP